MISRLLALLGLCAVLMGCQESVTRNEGARILAIGDSLMTWNSTTRRSVPHIIEKELGEPVVDRAVAGAWMTVREGADYDSGMAVPFQYVQGDWDWVIINGGGNDLLFGCGCGVCDGVLDRMISADGTTGQIPDLVRKIHADGAQVLYFGYLRSPNLLTPIEHCKDDGDELERRIARMAGQEEGIVFATMGHIVPPGGIRYFSPDLIHPSRRGSRAIGERLAKIIREYDTRG
ncbi:SGNH/GDSL hydrolase family protein [Lutimaribacter marinistellae]|uniref:SGNH/GDSL hydrolase family protein n=1 Tax=Lutimaribacter marinistellae TaxID=1820329 RepID=A0ABV7TGJ0_9RHOB